MFNKFIVHKNNLVSNIKNLKARNVNSLVCVMVKANAYGVGLNIVVKTLSPFADFFGVANLVEAKQVKKLTSKKVLIVGCLEHDANLNNAFSYTCNSLEDVQFLLKQNKVFNIHIKINSGMNRFGISNKQEFLNILKIIRKSKLRLEGLYTHFATDDDYVNEQFKIFKTYVKLAHKSNFYPLLHADNSSVNAKHNHNLNMIRIGFDLYNKSNENFKTVVEIKSKIVQMNNCSRGSLIGYNYRYVCPQNKQVAIIPIGYADGFSTKFIGLKINFKGKMCKVLNVCMDCFMLDTTKVQTKKGDAISILGDGNSLSNYATYSGLSEYEIMCNFSHIRAKRQIIN